MSGDVWDVVVVGAGPAGCAAALEVLARRPAARVLIVDRSGFPRDKVCGDGIAAQALDALADLGVDRGEITGGYPARRRLQLLSPGGRAVDRRMRADVHVIPRLVFDARLLAAARLRGATFVRHTVRAVEQSAGQVVLDGGLRARVVIGADGAESSVRRALGIPSNRAAQMAVAIRGYTASWGGDPEAQVLAMAGHHWPAYAWAFPVGPGLTNVGYGELSTGQPPTRTTLISRMHALLGVALGPEVTALRGHRLPLSTGRPAITPGRVLLVGDALSLINPLSGEGIYYAIRSGQAAGAASGAGVDAGSVYRVLLGRRLRRHLRQTAVVARLMRWPALIDRSVAAADRHQDAFDDLVELALGEGLVTARLIVRLHR